MTSPGFHPVVLGSDLGAYSAALAFFEQWGVRGTLVTRKVLGPIAGTSIAEIRKIPTQGEDAEYPDYVAGLLKIAPELQEKYPGQKLVLFANIDTYVWEIVTHVEELEKYYCFNYPTFDVVKRTNSKVEFPALAEKYGMSVPPTLTIDLDDGVATVTEQLRSFPHKAPWVIKSALGVGYEMLTWPGKKKVYFVDTLAQAEDLVADLDKHTAEVPNARRFVVQPRIHGNDTYNLCVTAYCDTHGRVTMLSSAHVLLEDHSPTALGNPAALITEPYPGLYEQVERFLLGVGWTGFANFDCKVDAKTGKVYFLEINPRVGRSMYYNVAGGINPTEFLVRDLVYGEKVPQRQLSGRGYMSVLPKCLVMRYVDKRLRRDIRQLHREGRAHYPFFSKLDLRPSWESLRRRIYLRLSAQKHWLKFAQNYPMEQHKKIGAQSYHTDELLHDDN